MENYETLMRLQDKIAVTRISLLQFNTMVEPFLERGKITDTDLKWVKKTRVRLKNKEYARDQRRKRREQDMERNVEMELLYDTIEELRRENTQLRNVLQTAILPDYQ